jgi:predicted ester cyclase
MASRKDFFLRIARSMSARDIDHVAEWFTEDFKLHNPSIGGFRSGHDGARDMLRSLAEHVPCARIDVLDMVEQGDKVAVRWIFSGAKDARPVYLSAVAITASMATALPRIGELRPRRSGHDNDLPSRPCGFASN